MAGKIYRRKKSSEFVTLDTHCLKNKELKWDAKGLHSYLVQLPEDWQINISDLVNRSKDGRDATTSPMKALMLAGYIIREMCFDEKGKFDGYDYFVFERPEHAEEWKTVNGKTVNGKTVNGKTPSSKNEYSLTENNSKNEQQQEQRASRSVAAGWVKLSIVDPEFPNTTFHEEFSLNEKPDQKGSIPAPAAPPPTARPYGPFDIDLEAATLSCDFRCIERFARDLNCSPEVANMKMPLAVAEFVEDQKTATYNYNNTREFRQHFFNWLPRKVAAKLAANNTATKQSGYSSNSTSVLPQNIRRL